MIARPTPRTADQSGFSLVEMLVVLSVLGFVLSGVTTFVISMTRTTNITTQRLTDLAETRVSMDAMARSMRAAVRLTSVDTIIQIAKDDHVRLIANFGSADPVQVEYEVINTTLVERRWEPDAGSVEPNFTYTGAPTTQRTVARDLDFSSGVPLFQFLDVATCPTDPTACTAMDTTADATTGLSALELNVVDAVIVTVSVLNANHTDIPSADLRTVITLRNSAYVPD